MWTGIKYPLGLLQQTFFIANRESQVTTESKLCTNEKDFGCYLSREKKSQALECGMRFLLIRSRFMPLHTSHLCSKLGDGRKDVASNDVRYRFKHEAAAQSHSVKKGK